MPVSKRKCNIIIDSCCDLPRDIVDALDVDLIEFPFIMSDGEHFDDLGVSMPSSVFYSRMRDGEEPKTAQVPVPVFIEAFTRALTSGVPTVYLAFGSGLSGSLETAQRIASELSERYPEGELHVVDTLLGSVAEALLVLEAVRQRDHGLSAAELVTWAEEARFYVHGYFTLDSLEALRRGGRIPDMAAYAGAMLDVKPILTFSLDGMLELKSASRGRKKSLRTLDGLFCDLVQNIGKTAIIVADADAEKDATSVEERLRRTARDAVVVRCKIGPVIGSHVGPGMVAVVFFGPDRREDISLTDRLADAARNAGSHAAAGMKKVLGKEGHMDGIGQETQDADINR